MPQIKEITSNVDQLRPSDRGIDAAAAAGRRIGSFYNQAGEAISNAARARADAAGDVAKSVSGIANSVDLAVVQNEDRAGHREIAAGAAAGAQLFSNLSDQWDSMAKAQAAKDPNDTSIADKFRQETLEPALEKFRDAFGNTDKGQQWAEAHIDRMRDHFYQKTSADMATQAGDAVKTNITNLTNSSSNAAFKSPDFHTVDYLLQSTPDSIGQIVDSSNVKGTLAAQVRTQLTEKAKEQIVKSAAAGAIAKSPDPEKTARDFADRYPQYMNGPEAATFARAAKQQAKTNLLTDKQIDVEKRKLADAAVHQAANKNMANNVTIDPETGSMVIKPEFATAALDIARKNPDSSNAATVAHAQLSWFEHQQKDINKPEQLARVSHATTMELIADIRAGKITDNGPIYDALGQNKLTRADFTFVNNELTQLKTPQGEALGRDRAEFFKKYAGTVDGAMDYGGHSALGSQRMYAFEMDARRQEQDLRTKQQDPHSLYDPESPNFLGKQVQKYQTTLTESMQYNKTISEQKQKGAPPASTNLTGPGKDVTGVQIIDIPKGMTAAEIIKSYKSGTKIRMPDGRTGAVP